MSLLDAERRQKIRDIPTGRKRQSHLSVSARENTLQLLRRHNFPLDIREHLAVKTMAEVREVLDAPARCMVKAILVAADATAAGPAASRIDFDSKFFLVGIPADRKIDFGKLAYAIQRSRSTLRLASPTEVEVRTGFRVGNVPPFGLPNGR